MITDLLEHLDRKRQEVDRLMREIETLSARIQDRQGKVDALQQDIGALESAYAVLRRDGVLEPTEAEGEETASEGGLAAAIRRVVPELPPPISTGAVRTILTEREPELMEKAHRTSVASTMRRMAAAGELEVVMKGGPGKEATYRLPVEQPRSEERADNQMTFEGERETVESAH